jgi:5-methylcytosine-specific restriction endonuclease McrA
VKLCNAPGCGKKHRARGMCSSHYNQATGNTDSAEAREARKVSKSCERCGDKFRSQGHHEQRFCSKSCARLTPSRRALAKRKLASAATGTRSARTWVYGACSQCDTRFTGPRVAGDRYCGKTCANRGSRQKKLANNPEVFRATRARHRRRYREAHPDVIRLGRARRRAREYAADHEPYNRTDIFAAYGNTCAYCDAPAEHLDHVVPISKGGADAPHNLLPACAPCNLSKSDKSLADWALSWVAKP